MFDYTIIQYYISDGESEPHGVLLQISNGDTQYLTMDEFAVFKANREKMK